MANPKLPIQSGSNLPGLDRDEDIHDAEDQEAQLDAFEDQLGLDPDEAEQTDICSNLVCDRVLTVHEKPG